MQLSEAQRQMRRSYRGGLHAQIVSGTLWAVSAAIASRGGHNLAILVLVVGGFFIFPLTVLALRLTGHRPAPGDNPLNGLAMQVAFTVPLGLPLVLTIAHVSPGRFYPAMLLLVGAHYLPFVTLYGMRAWFGLAGAMIAAGYVLGWVRPMGFAAGGWIGAALLLAFAFTGWRIVAAEERRGAA